MPKQPNWHRDSFFGCVFKRKLTGHFLTWGAAIFLLLMVLESSIRANGIYGNGTGARSMSMGGTDVAWAESPLEAMGDNPAGLGFLTEREFDLGGIGAITEGHFNKPSASSSGDLNDTLGGLPEAALGLPLGQSPLSIGISFIPDSMLLADWKYLDPPGGLGGVSYGVQPDKSEIIVLRSAIGMGLTLTPELSLGASIGLIYNENRLQTPYIFQNLQPPSDALYDGAKTLLNLHTSGFGWNAQAGLLYRPLTNLQFGISYKSQYTVNSTGGASGDPYAQFGVPPGPLAFHYDAEVDNTFPQQVSLGASWKFHPQWRAAMQVDWIDWSDAFHTLPVILKNGNNPTVNSVLGSSFQDNIPLNWKNEFVYRAGLEYAVTENLSLRAGYSYGKSPVPDSTLTPMTAAIMEHTVTAGVGYRWRQFQFDLAYQYDLPVTRNVVTSGLLSGEYSNSSTEVGVHWLALTTSIRF
jgi:long-chain fatty acid transport protein